jgi:transposase, IS5 family
VRANFGKRHRFTLVHGRHATPVEVLLRMLICKHLHQWSYQETEEQVDQNLILRWFCGLYWAPVPDESTLVCWANTLRPETLHALNDRVVQLARQALAGTPGPGALAPLARGAIGGVRASRGVLRV